MSQLVLGRLIRSAVLLVVGAMLANGAVSIAAATGPAATSQVRIYSCAGFDFHAIDSQTTFTWAERAIQRTSNKGDGWFMCQAALPHRAVVTRVRFTIIDNSDVTSYDYCGLVRVPLGVTGQVQPMGFALTGTGVAAMPGAKRYSGASIVHATVDNGAYAYTLQCLARLKDGVTFVAGGGGIVGADVTYRISAANG